MGASNSKGDLRHAKIVAVESQLDKRKRDHHEYNSKLREWSTHDYIPRQWILGCIPIPHVITNASWMNENVSLGFTETIATFLWNKSFGIGDDGMISDEILQAHQEEVKTLIDGYLNLLVNFGVIGALLVALLFQFTINDITIAQSTLDLFGDTASIVIKYIFLALMNALVCCAAMLIVRSVMLYKQLSFWMVSNVAKIKWINQVNLVPIIVITQSTLFMLCIAIPFGAVVSIGPIPGLISSIIVTIASFFVTEAGDNEFLSIILVHEECRRLFSKDDSLV